MSIKLDLLYKIKPSKASGRKLIEFVPTLNIPREFVHSQEAQKLLQPNNALVKGFNKLTYKHLHVFENEGNELGALPLFFFVIIWMQGNRYFRARNKDEKREVLTRDVASGFMAFFITYAIQRFFAKIMENKIHVPATVKTTDKKTNFFDWFSRKSGDMYIKSYKEIGETYSAKTPEQLRQYIDYIPLKHGQDFLNKLPETYKQAWEYLKTQTNFFDKTADLNTLLKHNRSMKENVDKVIEGIEKYIVPRAKIAKVVPDAIATLTGIIALGWIIPRFNIVHTRKLYEDKGNKQQIQASELTTLPQAKSTNPVLQPKLPLPTATQTISITNQDLSP